MKYLTFISIVNFILILVVLSNPKIDAGAKPNTNKEYIENALPTKAVDLIIIDEYKGWFYFTLDGTKYLGKLNRNIIRGSENINISFTKCG